MEGVRGVCYDVVGDNLPSRADLVQLHKSNNIQAMRIYMPDQAALILDVGGVDTVRACTDASCMHACMVIW
jgi:hypothetical protein